MYETGRSFFLLLFMSPLWHVGRFLYPAEKITSSATAKAKPGESVPFAFAVAELVGFRMNQNLFCGQTLADKAFETLQTIHHSH